MVPEYTRQDVEAWLLTLTSGTLSLLVDNTALARDTLAYIGAAGAEAPAFDGQPSEHFTWKEFLWSDTAADSDTIENIPAELSVLTNIKALAEVMESVRLLCGSNPVSISSGYRSPETNTAVGGAPDSAHLSGCACDFTIPAYGDVTEIVQTLKPVIVELGIDQLIHEGTWIHLGLAVPPNSPRHECFAL